MKSDTCRWGILGTATIARKNWQAIRDAGNATVIAVASRDPARSRQFIDECQSEVPFPAKPVALGSYEEAIAHPDLDALYIPLPTGVRKPWVIRAAQAGKHVLVEKPLGRNAAEVAEMIAACEAAGVQFMDGVMFMHGQRLRRLREILDDGKSVGEIRRVTAQFSFAGGEEFIRGNIRARAELEPLGCLGDLGWYCVRFALWALRYEMPQQVVGRLHSEAGDGPGKVPMEFSGDLLFANGVSASFHCSFVAENAEWVMISGTKGYIHVPDFVLPFAGAPPRFSAVRSEFDLRGCRFEMREGRADESIAEPANNAPGSQESNMFRAFSRLVLDGKIDPHWPDIALRTQRVLDACLLSARRGSAAVDLEA